MASRLVLTLAVGREARELLAVTGPAMRAYAGRVGAAFRVISDPAISPHYALAAKFQCGQYLRAGWDRLLFLDADCVLAPDCPDLFGVVPESHAGLYEDRREVASPEWLVAEYRAVCASQGWEAFDPGTCLNTGVMVASRAHAAMFDPPRLPYPVTHCSEQNLINLNVARHAVPVHALPAAANWQWWARGADFGAPGKWVYHLSGAGEAGVGRLALARDTLGRLYPARPQCRHRSDAPTQFAGGCCGDTDEVIAGAHEYDCALHDCSCCTGLPLSELRVRRCRVCPDHDAG